MFLPLLCLPRLLRLLLQAHYASEEAQECRAAKEAAVVEKEQVAVRAERRAQAHEVSGTHATFTPPSPAI